MKTYGVRSTVGVLKFFAESREAAEILARELARTRGAVVTGPVLELRRGRASEVTRMAATVRHQVAA